MEVAALVIAIAAIVLTVIIEWLKRPRLRVNAVQWRPSSPVDWTFAAVRVHNRPLSRPLRWLLTRQSAEGCAVATDFRRREDLVLNVPGRWSSNPEPLRSVPVPSDQPPEGASFIAVFDRSLDPPRRDVPPSEEGEEVAVAVLKRDGTAYAWGTDSYGHDGWAKPEWRLDTGTYLVEVHVTGSGIKTTGRFKLEFLSGSFNKFDLKPA